MSRAGYCDGFDCDYTEWDMIRWRGAVASAFRGKRGQAFLRELVAALDAMPEKRLIAHELKNDAGVCALGCVGVDRGMEMATINPEDYTTVAASFDISGALAREIMWANDEGGPRRETPENRWQRVRNWAAGQIKP